MTSLNGERPEEGSTTITSDELAAFSNLTREEEEIMETYFRPFIRQLVEERIGLAPQELLASMKEHSSNKTRASTSVPRRFKLKFRNRISLPVFTGVPLLGENQTTIEIALVDALTEQIVNTGIVSTAKLEIIGFRVGDDGNDSWTVEEFQNRIMSERQGKRILQGNTCLQLKEGIGFVCEIRFTHDSKHTKNGWYRLGAIVVDADLMKQVEIAWTETFFVKDKRSKYYEKHPYPFLSDKVCHLEQIRYKGTRYKRLQDEKVKTVRDLLILLYTDMKQLEDILEVKPSSKIWDDIVKNAQASNGMFLYLDPRKTGIVLDVKLQLKALVVEPRSYIPVKHLSDQQRVEAQNLVKFASEHLKALDYFEDEASLKKHLQSNPALISLPDGPPRTCSLVADACLNNSNRTPFVTFQSERGKEKIPCGDQEYISIYPCSPNRLNFWSAEPGTSDISGHTLGDSELNQLINAVSPFLYGSPSIECHSSAAVCAIARTRWTKVSKLLRRNSVRERISLSQGIQYPLKKQKCF